MSTPATLCRLEYLTPTGWVVANRGIALLHPKRYVERLTERGKIGRCTELTGPNLEPGKVHESPKPHRRSRLVPDPPSPVPKLAHPDLCRHCDDFHLPPFDGACLL